MGLFGFGGKKEKAASASKSDKISFNGASDASSAKCIMTAGVRGVEIDINMGGDGASLTHGPVSAKGEAAIVTYFDRKGKGASLRPKKATILAEQNYWIDVASQFLDKGEKVNEVLNTLNNQLSGNEFVVGKLSLADPVVAGSVLALKKAGNLPSGLSNVEAWLGRVEETIPENLRSNYMSQLA